MFNGLNVKHIIEKKGYTQKEACEGARIKRETFNSIISKSENPTAKNIEALADFLKCSIDDFFDRDVEYASISIGHTVKGDGNQVCGDISINEYQKEIEHLKELLIEKDARLAEKDARLVDKDKVIELLTSRIVGKTQITK
jgi:transcriptional regulator with XRE-family HTH domain